MTIYRTLNQFIDEQITKFEIPNTEENKKKLRAKFMRVLKELNFWDNAETRIIGRAKTKIFNNNQLAQLYSNVQNYLIKCSPIDKDDLNKYITQATEAIEHFHNMSQEDYMNEQQYEPPTVSRNMLNDAMLQALFEIFFEPINTKLWNDDLEIAHFTDFQDIDTPEYYLVQKRLNNPTTAYITKRKNKK